MSGVLRRSPVTVGRDAELTTIDGVITQARAGRGACLVIVGEPGAGKTRLLREIEARAARRSMQVLAADAPVTVASPPFGMASAALRSWIRQAGADAEALRPYAAGLRGMLPELAGPAPAPDLPADQLRLLFLEGALQAMIAAARPAGAVVLFDDLQNADPETVELLTHAATSIGRYPLLIACAIRAGGSAAETEARALERRGRASVVDLGMLDEDAVARMVEALLGTAPPRELVADLMQRTDGSPLLVEELVAAYAAAGALRAEGRRLSWTSPGRTLVPKTIRDLVNDLVGRLTPDAATAVWTAAVLGRLEPSLVSAVSGVEGDALDAALGEATTAGLLDPAGARFRHALVLQATYESIPAARRTSLHAKAAEVLGARHGDDPALLEERARHHVAVGEPAKAGKLLLAAARRDLQAQAPASAAAVAERGQAIPLPPAVADELEDVRASAYSALGRWEDALVVDRRLPPDAARLRRMARNALMLGRLDEADDLVARASAAGADPGPVRALSGLVALWRGDFDRAIGEGRTALELGERSGNAAVICDSLDVIGRACDMIGRRDEAIEVFRRWAATAEAAGLTASRAQALMELGNVEYLARHSPATLRRVRELSREIGAYTTLVLADLSLTWCLGILGELREATETAEEAVETCRHFGLGLLPHALIAAGWVHGRVVPDSGSSSTEEALEVSSHDPDVKILANENLADSAFRAGRIDEACSHYDTAVAAMIAHPAPPASMTPFVRPCVLLAAGRREAAERAVEEARNLEARTRTAVNEMWFASAEAMLAGSAEALDRAFGPERTFERALAYELGAQTIGGDRAAEWLREAVAVFESAGAEVDADRARRRLRSLGEAAPRRKRRRGPVPEALAAHGVTRREAEVLDLIAAGMPNTEIAEKLFLSVRTVESHVSSLLTKLGRDNRAALVAAGLKDARRDDP